MGCYSELSGIRNILRVFPRFTNVLGARGWGRGRESTKPPTTAASLRLGPLHSSTPGSPRQTRARASGKAPPRAQGRLRNSTRSDSAAAGGGAARNSSFPANGSGPQLQRGAIRGGAPAEIGGLEKWGLCAQAEATDARDGPGVASKGLIKVPVVGSPQEVEAALAHVATVLN